MKNSLYLIIFFVFSLFIFGCEKKDDGPTGPGIEFNINPQLNKIYNFQRWLLDSLDQKREGPFFYYEKCAAKNLNIGGKNDVVLSITYHNPTTIDSVYLRFENGKDVYEWVDTTNFLFSEAREYLMNQLKKVLQNYAWIPRILLSKGNNAEYILLPKKVYTIQPEPNLFFNISIEIIAKNEGFEDVTVPAGTYRCYKVKTTFKTEIFLPQSTQPLERINFITYYWINDDLDWWIKQFRPTVKSSLFGVVEFGQIDELTSVQ